MINEGTEPRIGVIENPLSQQNKKGKADLFTVAEAAKVQAYAQLDDFAELGNILRSYAEKGIDLLVISGGDGTVQGVLTALVMEKPFESLPRLAILPRGMTNMTAADIGLKGRGLKGFHKLITVSRRGELTSSLATRRLLRLDNIKGFDPQVGMFFGTAGITRAIEYCRRSVHSLKFESEIANGLTMAKLLLRWVFNQGQGDEVLHGDSIDIKLDGKVLGTEDYLLVIATTLEKLVLNSRPFWNGAEGGLHFTRVTYPPKRLLRNARKVLYGGKERNLDPSSYLSEDAREIELSMSCSFTLDGQLFEPQLERPLILSAPQEASFVRL